MSSQSLNNLTLLLIKIETCGIFIDNPPANINELASKKKEN